MNRFISGLTLFLSASMLCAQSVVITGTVTSEEDGLPVIGVAVLDKQTQRGTVTDEDGAFSLSVPERTKVLQFSYVGFRTHEVTIPTGRNMKVVMQPDAVLIDEVMVHSAYHLMHCTHRLGMPIWSMGWHWWKS